MAKKDNVDLDDFDLDDFDFDVPEWGGDEVDDKSRSPIQKALGGAVEGAKAELTPSQLKNTVVLALPAGYGLASDTLENISTDAKSLYDTITGDSPELVKISKSFGRKAMNLAGNKVLPKKISDRLNDAFAESDSEETLKSNATLEQEREEAELQQLTEIFRAKAEADETRAQTDDIESIEQKALDQARFKSSMEALEAINRSIARLVGYQDNITVKYQQKALELQYRQFAVGQKQLELMSVASGKHEKVLEAIRHNTALPEAVKIRGSEIFGLMARQRLADGGINSLSNFARNYSKQIYDNAKAMIGGAVGDAGSMGDQIEGSGISKAHIFGSMVGSGVTSKVRDYAAMQMAPILERNPWIARGNEKLRGTFSGLPQKINEFASSETKGSGFKSVLLEAFKRFLPQYHIDTRIGGDDILDLDQPAVYDKMARRSIIEIIPGHLADIAHWTKTLATGTEGSREVYNPVRGGFSTEQEQEEDIGRQIISLDERNNIRNSIEDFVKTTGMDGLSGDAMDVFKRKLLTELASNRDLKPERLSDGGTYAGASADVIEEITTAVRDSFSLDMEGQRLDNSTEGDARFNDLADQYYRMASLIPGITDRIRVLGDTTGREALRNLGYVKRDGLTDRIDIDTAWDTVLKIPEEGHDAQTSPADEGEVKSPAADIGAALRGLIGRPVAHPEPAVEPAGPDTRAIDATEAERRYRRRPVKLERYLGDKSTLIRLLSQSRDYHAELVALVKDFDPCCPGDSKSSGAHARVDEIRNLSSSIGERFSKYATQAGDKAHTLKDAAKDKWNEVSRLLTDLKEQGRDHPLAKEAELWLGETKDELGERAEWLKNYRYDGGDTRYQERYGGGLFGPRTEGGDDGSLQARAGTIRNLVQERARQFGKTAQEKGTPLLNKAMERSKPLRDRAATKWDRLSTNVEEGMAAVRDQTAGKSMRDKVGIIANLARTQSGKMAGPTALAAQDKLQNLFKSMQERFSDRTPEMPPTIVQVIQSPANDIDTRYQEKYGAGLFGVRPPREAPKEVPTSDKEAGKDGRMKRTFKPRIKSLMSKLTGGKLGSDISSELTGDAEQDQLTLGLRNAQLQWEILKQVTTEKVRKGSYLDRLTRRKDAKDEKAEVVDEKKSDTSGLAKLLGMLGMGGGGGGGIMDNVSDMFESFMEMKMMKDLFGERGQGKDKKTRNRDRIARNRANRLARPKATGKIGRGLQMIRNLGGAGLDRLGTPGRLVKGGLKLPGQIASKAWGFGKGAVSMTRRVAGSKAGRAIGSGLWWGAKRAGLIAGGAALGAASFIGAPVIATALAAIGVVTTGLSIYKWLKGADTIPPLSRLRMVQYGVNPDPKSKEVEKLLQLEQLFKRHTKIGSEGRAEVDVAAVPPEALQEIFGYKTEGDPSKNETFMKMRTFLNGRFAAVYLKWVGEYHALHKSIDLSSVDERLKGEEAIAFVDKVAMEDRTDAFSSQTDPFNKDGWVSKSKLPMGPNQVKQMVEEVKAELKKESERRPSSKPSVMGFKVDSRGNVSMQSAWKPGAKPADKTEEVKQEASGATPSVNLSGKTTTTAVTAAAAAVTATGAMTGPQTSGTPRLTGMVRAGRQGGSFATGLVAAAATATGMMASRVSPTDVELDDGRSVRYRIYGLTEMDALKVAQLASLEDSLWSKVYYRDGTATVGMNLTDQVELLHRLRREIFTYTTRQEALDLGGWMDGRFLSTFTAYCNAVRKRSPIDAKDAHIKLDGAQYLEVLRETSQATVIADIPVWEMTQSPWPNYILNRDPSSIEDALSVVASRATSKLLREPEGIQQGRVKDADGNWVTVDPTQANRPTPKDEEERTRQEARQERKETEKAETEQKEGLWSRFKGMFGSDKEDKKAPQQGALNAGGQSVHPTTAHANTGVSLLRSSIPISHPGGGTGGDVNEIPEPKGDGWDANKETLMSAANMVGVDPQLAASVAGVESGFRPHARPYKNPRRPELGTLSSAASYYQVINATWKELMGKYASKYGIAPETTQHDPRANALLGLEYVRENVDKVKGVVKGRPVAATDAYLAHFLGPSGAKRFLSAPPSAPATQHVQPSQATSNPGIFRPGGRVQSVEQVYTDFDNKLKRHAQSDAPTVAASLRSEAEREPNRYTEDGELIYGNEAQGEQSTAQASTAPTEVSDTGPVETTVQPSAPEVPSMVRAAVESVVPDDTYTPPSDGTDVVERATTRAVSSSTRDLQTAARVAEIQTSAQTRTAARELDSNGEGVRRLIGVNESQLEQLVSLVALLKGGITVNGGGSTQEVAQGQQLNAGTSRPTRSTRGPAPAKEGTVSVSRS